MSDKHDPHSLPDQLIEIASQSESSAEKVMNQIEIVSNSFEEMLNLAKEGAALLYNEEMPPEDRFERIEAIFEEMITYSTNGLENTTGIFDMYQYQDIVRQKLEKVAKALVDISEFIMNKLKPSKHTVDHLPPSGRDILSRDHDDAGENAVNVDDIIKQFMEGGGK